MPWLLGTCPVGSAQRRRMDGMEELRSVWCFGQTQVLPAASTGIGSSFPPPRGPFWPCLGRFLNCRREHLRQCWRRAAGPLETDRFPIRDPRSSQLERWWSCKISWCPPSNLNGLKLSMLIAHSVNKSSTPSQSVVNVIRSRAVVERQLRPVVSCWGQIKS